MEIIAQESASLSTLIFQVYKYITYHIFSKTPLNAYTLYVPIIIEHIKTWAMIDTGSFFFCVSPSFCSALCFVSIPNQDSIKLGHNSSSTVSQLGIINLTVYYNRVRLTYEFEVFDFSSDIPICLGLDILPKLRIDLTELNTA
jgi:hypothetical protein